VAGEYSMQTMATWTLQCYCNVGPAHNKCSNCMPVPILKMAGTPQKRTANHCDDQAVADHFNEVYVSNSQALTTLHPFISVTMLEAGSDFTLFPLLDRVWCTWLAPRA